MTLSNGTLSSHPLSPVQTGMLFQTLWRPKAGFYIQQLRVRFSRRVDPDLLRAAWNYLLARHDSLRACIVFVDQENPRLRFADTAEVPFHFEDWTTSGPAGQKRRLSAYLREDRLRAFAFETAPLMRIALFRCGVDDFRMVWTSHHLLFDGRSRYILLQELAKIYRAVETARLPDLPPAPAFREFLHWIDTEDFSKAEGYWSTALAGIAEPTPIGFGAATRSDSGSEKRQRHVTRFSPALLRRLEKFSQQHEFTLNTLFQAAWAVVLSRYSRQQDVVFGAPRACRNCPVPNIGSTVGVFVNTLPVRARVNDDALTSDFLRGQRENWVAMRPFEQTPLREIHQWCQLPEGHPLFDSLVGFETYQMAERLALDDPWWAGTSMALDGWTNFALTIQAYRGRGIELMLTYDPARFSSAAIRRLSGHLHATLTGFLSAKAKTLGDLPLLTTAERRQVVEVWNTTAAPYPSNEDVAVVFSRVAQTAAAATALIMDDRRMGYRELEDASNDIAAWLQARGIGRGDRIGVLLERSFEQVEAIIGILKAGAAYVPLDSEYPLERLRFMIGDASLRLVLGDEQNQGALGTEAVAYATVAQVHAEARKAAGVWRPLPADADAPAYVIYTSGSTGTPKGVVVPHRGILRLVFGVDYVHLGPGRTLLHMAPVSFDASTFELWGALLHGARCVLYPSRRPQISELARQIETHGVDTLWLTAALFNFVIDEAPEILRPVRQLLAGGEALSPAHVAKALARLPDTQLINGYGPTETTTFACCHSIAREGFNAGQPVPIGRTIGNTTAYVLDQRMRPVPIGVEGELFIGGAGVALGYLNRPELTKERFVPDPFAARSGAQLYRTGDLVCWREDGLLEFRGRMDDQVKIRGFRIEPGEIARALQDHPAVKQAAVVAAEAPGGKELVAFYTTDFEREVQPASLRSFLSERLPGYMIPARFFAVAEIPRTMNGKIDRAALLQAGPATGGPTAERVEPTTEVGRRLAALWAEILGVKGCAANESFFSMGGDSLSASRLIHRIERNFGVEIPFRVFFEAPTISRLEQLVRRNEPPAEQPSITTFRRIERGDRWPASESQASYVESCFRPENLRRQNIVRAFRMTGELNVACLVRSIRWVSRQNEALSTRFVIDAPGRVFQVRSDGECPVEILDLTGLREEQRQPELQRILLDEQDHLFDPDAPWMHRFRVLVVSPREHVLICSFHHANFDGPSLNAFYWQLSESYRRFTAGKDADGSAETVQQSEVLAWLEQWMTPERRAHSCNFWRTALAGAPHMELPYAEPAGPNRNEPGRIEYLTIDTPTVERLNLQARRHGVSLYQLFLAGFSALINRVGRNDDVLVAINVDLRTHGSFAGVIGSFPQRLMIRITLEPDLRFSGVVSRVASRMSEALPHRYLPFDEIRKLCGSDVGYKSPLDRVFFVQSTEDAEELALPDVICSQIPRELQRPRGMLSAGMREVAGGVELRAPHIPAFVPTETVRSMLALFQFIMATIATGADPRLSELPRLGEPLVSRDAAGTADPPSDVASQVLQVVRETLGTTTAGPLDSFFELGGNSLLATKLIHRIEQSLGLFIPFHALFANPTARSLAAFLATADEARTEPTIESFRPENRGDRWLLGAARADAVKFTFQPENLRRRNVVRAFRLSGNLDRDALVAAIQWVVSRHEALSTHYVVEAGDVYQVRNARECPVGLRDLTGLPADQREAEIRRFQHAEETRAFDPTAEWMHHFQIVLVAPLDHVLLLNLHHANFDGISLNTLYRELAERYRGYVTGDAIDLPTVVPQQTDVHNWLGLWPDPSSRARSRAFWRTTLEGAPALELPLTAPGDSTTDAGHIERISFPAPLVEKLNRRARDHGVTLYQLFLAGLNILLSRVGNNDDIAIGIGIDLRTHGSLADAIGCFVTRITIRTRLDRDPTISEVVRQVASRMQAALAHRYLPIEEIHELCASEETFRNIGMIRFTHTGEQDGLIHLADVRCSEIPRGHHQPLGILAIGMREFAGGVELRASHNPAILPTENVRAMLALLDGILTTLSLGQNPRLSELPRLDETRAQDERSFAVRTNAETTILALFRTILNRPDAGPHDSFFELGGHSLLATMLLHRIEQALGANIPFHILHEKPTARQLAASLETLIAPNDGPKPTALVRRISTMRERVNVYTQREIRSLQNPGTEIRNITRAFVLRGRVDAEMLRRAMQWVINRHDAMRTRLVEGKPGEFWREMAPVEVNLVTAELPGGPSAGRIVELDRLIAAESNHLFTVDSFPFHLFKLLRVAPEEHVLILTFHHVFFDGRSLPVFFRELSTAYAALSHCEEPDLPPPAYQFGDVVRWIDDWLASGSLNRLREYWKKRLHGISTLQLPTDLVAEREGEHLGTMVHRPIGRDLTRRAADTAKKLGTTHFGFNHGITTALVHSCGNHASPDVGIVCCIRTHPDAHEVIGNFNNPIIIRTDVSGNPSFGELARRTRAAAREALTHSLFPYAMMLDLLPPVAKRLENPLQQVRLSEEPYFRGEFNLPGVVIEPLPRRSYTLPAMIGIQVTDRQSDLIVRCTARPEYFSNQRTEQLLDQYELFLRLATDDPTRRLHDFPAFRV